LPPFLLFLRDDFSYVWLTESKANMFAFAGIADWAMDSIGSNLDVSNSAKLTVNDLYTSVVVIQHFKRRLLVFGEELSDCFFRYFSSTSEAVFAY